MSTEILIPDDFNFSNSIKFSNYIDSIPEDTEYTINYGKMSKVEPFGLLFVGAKIRQFRYLRPQSTFTSINYENNTYAAHMGFYKSVWLEHGKAPGEANGSDTYVPITELKVQDIKDESFSNIEHIVDTIERKTEKLSLVLSQNNEKLHQVLTYSLREIFRNVVEHSTAESLWYAGQYWPTKDRVEIAILDEGIGIPNSLRSNRKLNVTNDRDALYLCIEPGISGKDIVSERKRDQFYGNSGYGLYMTSRICEDGGDFIVGSCSKILGLNIKKNAVYDVKCKGTIIRMRLNVSKIIGLQAQLNRYIIEGRERAKKNNLTEVLSASQSSRLLINSKSK